jgi:hypothetical protein
VRRPRRPASGLGAAEVAALARAVADGEQAEQPLDPRPAATQVLGRFGVVERLAGGDQQRFVGRDQDLSSAARGRDAAIAQRAGVAGRPGERRAALAGGLGADHCAVAGRTGHAADTEIDPKVVLGQPPVLDWRLRDRGENVDLALGQLGADRPRPVGRVAQQPLGPPTHRPGRRGDAWPVARLALRRARRRRR